MAGVGTGMSVDTPGTSRVIIGDKLQGAQHKFQPSTSPDWGSALCRGPSFCHTPHPFASPFGIAQASGPVRLIATTLLPRLHPTLES